MAPSEEVRQRPGRGAAIGTQKKRSVASTKDVQGGGEGGGSGALGFGMANKEGKGASGAISKGR